MIVTLKSNSCIVKIDSTGSELISFLDIFGTEYIWQKDKEFWPRSSPLLFPIVGNLRNDKTIINNDTYNISKHGFVRDMDFEVVYTSGNKAIFSLSYSEETLKIYPYKFNISMTYLLNDDKLNIEYKFTNLGSSDMNYCFGAHPAFKLPINKDEKFEDYQIIFNKEENNLCPIYNQKNLHLDVDDRHNYLETDNKTLNLKYSLFNEDAIIFDKINSDGVKLINKFSSSGIQFDFKDFDFIAFWTPAKKQAEFLCIEPWCGLPVCSDESDEYSNKRGIRKLKQNQDEIFNIIISPI